MGEPAAGGWPACERNRPGGLIGDRGAVWGVLGRGRQADIAGRSRRHQGAVSPGGLGAGFRSRGPAVSSSGFVDQHDRAAARDEGAPAPAVVESLLSGRGPAWDTGRPQGHHKVVTSADAGILLLAPLAPPTLLRCRTSQTWGRRASQDRSGMTLIRPGRRMSMRLGSSASSPRSSTSRDCASKSAPRLSPRPASAAAPRCDSRPMRRESPRSEWLVCPATVGTTTSPFSPDPVHARCGTSTSSCTSARAASSNSRSSTLGAGRASWSPLSA